MLVRVYDTASATLLREFRRGADRATIYSIAFSATNEFLACSSDKGTVHVWAVPDDANQTTPEESDARAEGVTEKKNREALLGGLGGSSISAESSATATTPSATTPMGVAQSALSFAAGFLPANLGLAGERSVAQFKLPDFTRVASWRSGPSRARSSWSPRRARTTRWRSTRRKRAGSARSGSSRGS